MRLINFSDKWVGRFMDLAQHVSTWSVDPSTKVGAVVVDPETKQVLGMGYNGFPRGVDDLPERYADRPTKYSLVVHAEANAILNANKPVAGAAIFIWPLFTCGECAKLIIQSGIKKVYAPKGTEERWASHYDVAMKMYLEAGVEYAFVS